LWWVLLRISPVGSLQDGVSDNSRRKDTWYVIAKYVRKGEAMELRLTKDKVTKNKVVRFADGENHNIYLQPDEVQALGNPETVKVTIEAE